MQIWAEYWIIDMNNDNTKETEKEEMKEYSNSPMFANKTVYGKLIKRIKCYRFDQLIIETETGIETIFQ